MATRAPVDGAPCDPVDGTVTAAPCTPAADTTTVTVRGTVGSTAIQFDGGGVAVPAVDVVVEVVAVDGAATAAADDEDVVDVLVDDVVVVAHHTGEGFGWEMVAVPARAAWKLACIVPSESYVPLARGSTLLSDENGNGYFIELGPVKPLGGVRAAGCSVRAIWSPTASCTGAAGRSCVNCTVVAAAAGGANSAQHVITALHAMAVLLPKPRDPRLTMGEV